ncbi:MAG: hypothetical protein ACRD0K_27520, partial [Egibacteraceae bacterium]
VAAVPVAVAPVAVAPVAVAPVAVAPVAVAPVAAAVGPEPEPEAVARELGLVVTAGYAGRPSQAAWTPVEVRLEPRRPVAGTLAVESQFFRGDSGAVREVRRVEVGAGSVKLYRFLVPTGPVRVVVEEPGRPPLALRVRAARADGGYLAGVLGELPDGLPPLRVEPLGQSGAWVPVDPAWLELSGSALAPLGGLVADLDTLGTLPERARRHLASAVALGTDLVVVADQPGPVDLAALGLPWSPVVGVSASAPGVVQVVAGSAWVIEDGGLPVGAAMPAGRGRLSVVTVAPGSDGSGRSAALWSTLLGPAPRVNASRAEWAVERTPWQFGQLFSDGDSTAPVVPWLAGFIALYVLVVGPVNGLVLARFRRRELAWATVPLVTVIFTAGAFVGATGASPLLSVGASLTWWVDGVGSDVVAVGVRGSTEGSHRVSLPGDGWSVQPMVDPGRTATLAAGENGQVIEMDLAALQLGGAIASRPAGAQAPLRLDAVARPGGIEVTVRNTSTQPVEQVLVRAATARTRLGALAPGESRTATVGRDRILPRDPYQPVFDTLEPGPTGAIEPPGSLEALLRTHLIDGSPGMVWAIGQGGASPPGGIQVDGGPPRDVGHLIIVGAHPRLPEDGRVTPLAVDRSALVDAEAYRPGPLSVEGARDAYLRFRFPPGGDLSTLYGDLERASRSPQFGGELPPEAAGQPRIELTVWNRDARQWLPLRDALPPGGQAQPGALLDPLGTLYVRASGDLIPFDFSARTVSGVPVGLT